jgi:hypothetical protein
MDMEMSIVHVTYPIWFRISVTALVVFVLAGVPLVRKSSRPVLLLALPVLFALGNSFAGNRQVARGLSTVGQSYHAAAAGAAESVLVVVFGLAAAATVATFSALRVRQKSTSRLSRPAAAFLLATFLLLVAAYGGLVYSITREGQTYSPTIARLATTAAVITYLLVVVAAIVAFSRREPSHVVGSVTFGVCATVSVVFGVVLWFVVAHFRDIAMGV